VAGYPGYVYPGYTYPVPAPQQSTTNSAPPPTPQ
jgi:hypothetical protein